MSILNPRLLAPLLVLFPLIPAMSAQAEPSLGGSPNSIQASASESQQTVASQVISSELEAIALQLKASEPPLTEARATESDSKLASISGQGDSSLRLTALMLAKIEKLQAKLQNVPVQTTEQTDSLAVATTAGVNAPEELKTEPVKADHSAASQMQTLISRLYQSKVAAQSQLLVISRNSDVHPGLAGMSNSAGEAQNVAESGDEGSKAKTELATDSSSPTADASASSGSQSVTAQPKEEVQASVTETAKSVTATAQASSEMKQNTTASTVLTTPESTKKSTELSGKLKSEAPQFVAQSSTTTNNSTVQSEDLNSVKNSLKIDPLIVTGQRTYPPSLSYGAPSAFGPQWGDLFFGLSGATAGKARGGQVDGSLSAGFGLGDSQKLIGVGLSYTMGSINNFGESGSFSLSASRFLYADSLTSVAIAGGWDAFAQYNNLGGSIPSGGWGGFSVYTLLQPDDPINTLPLLISAGAGGGYYRQGTASTGVFGGIGLQVAPQLGMGVAWSGVGLNVGMSWVPIPTVPLTLVATGADLTDNSDGGTRFILSLSYGYNFLPTPTQ